ncbi:MAG: hypothetical protein LBE12_13965 [Planctomycetaceae bacterium]|jgi:hypothetical protein|nr:hypothetical protein [Planctomycetaceae bacterium]
MNFIEHYFMNRINYALDYAQPLDRWTAWYVRKNPKLWEYYTDMLKLELELRFPYTQLDNKNIDNFNNIISSNQQNRYSKDQINPQQIYPKNHWQNYLFKNRIGISAAIIFLAFFAVWAFLNFSEKKIVVDGIPTELAKDQKIDLGDIFDELYVAEVPLTKFVSSIKNPFKSPFKSPFESPFKISFESSFNSSIKSPANSSVKSSFESPLLEFPVEPIVCFTDHPLESTLTFLETTGIIRSSNHERD